MLSVFWDTVTGNAAHFPYENNDLSDTVNVEYGFTVQSIEITPAPEPSPLALADLGGLAILLFLRRK
jgi:hypothetical protein